MKFTPKDPPRVFEAGQDPRIEIKDCGFMELQPDEQVTFLTGSGAEYDLCRKDWGFYATPSLNSRLKGFGLRAVLVKNTKGFFFVYLVEAGKEDLLERYMRPEGQEVVCWLDTDEALARLEHKMKGAGGK